MTSFQDGKIADTAKEPEKPAEEKPIIPPSRIMNNPRMWEQAGEIADMLTYCRPHQSKIERKFIAKFIVPLGVKYDKFGNAYKQVGDNPVVLWSSHTDTVHSVQGYQKIQYWQDIKTGDVHYEVNHEKKAWQKQSSCLGADDTVGVWLMIEMIRNNIPGLYIFHRGEECGGLGSKWIAEKNKDALKGIRFAIAFDRRAEKSIITFQRSTRCCSDEFANSLAEQLGMDHKCDETGSFTDTASYVDLIAECTNISAGYQNAHMRSEYTNIDYLFRLRDALLKIDVTKLVEKRKPGENERKSYSYSGGSYGHHWCDDGWFQDIHGVWRQTGSQGSLWSKTKAKKNHKKEEGKTGFELRKELGDHWMRDYEYDYEFGLWFLKATKVKSTGTTYQEATKLVRENPGAILDLLEHAGYGPNEVKDWLLAAGVDGCTVIM